MAIAEDIVRESLKSVVDPELFVNIVDLGLIYEIKFLSVGLPAPAVEGQTRSGRTISLASLRGKAVVLVFWGTT